jgi:dihydroneopterin aldolase
MLDLIRIVDLEIWSTIGVPDEEREKPQRLLVDLELRVKDIGPASMTDNVKLTIDYAVVTQRIKTMAEARPRRLIVPGTRHVSVRIERPKGGRTAAVFRPGHSTSLRMSRDTGRVFE